MPVSKQTGCESARTTRLRGTLHEKRVVAYSCSCGMNEATGTYVRMLCGTRRKISILNSISSLLTTSAAVSKKIVLHKENLSNNF